MRIYTQTKNVLGYEEYGDDDVTWIRFERWAGGKVIIDKCGEVALTARQAAKVAEFLTQHNTRKGKK